MQHDRSLCARRLAQGVERRAARAGDVALSDGPLHRGGSPGADLGAIGVAAQRTGCRGRAHVAVQDGRNLLTRDVGVRGELARAGAVDNVVLVSPEDCIVVVVASLDVVKRVRRTGDGGRARRAVENCDELSARQVILRGEGIGALAVDKIVVRAEVDGVGRPGTNVLAVTSVNLLEAVLLLTLSVILPVPRSLLFEP